MDSRAATTQRTTALTPSVSSPSTLPSLMASSTPFRISGARATTSCSVGAGSVWLRFIKEGVVGGAGRGRSMIARTRPAPKPTDRLF